MHCRCFVIKHPSAGIIRIRFRVGHSPSQPLSMEQHPLFCLFGCEAIVALQMGFVNSQLRRVGRDGELIQFFLHQFGNLVGVIEQCPRHVFGDGDGFACFGAKAFVHLR